MTEAGFSIGELSEQTGVKPVTLRAWERRYGLLHPGRSDSGHRVYSEADVVRVREVVSWLQQGVTIGQVPGLLRGGPASPGEGPASVLVESALRFRQHKLDQLLGRCLAEQPLDSFTRDTLVPARQQLRDVGGDAGAALALLDGVLLHKLGALLLKHSRRTKRQAAWLVVAVGVHESRLMAALYALALVETGAEVLALPHVVSGAGLQALLDSERAGQVLLVAGPEARAVDWRRLRSSAKVARDRWLVAGNGALASESKDMQILAGEPWAIIQRLQQEARK